MTRPDPADEPAKAAPETPAINFIKPFFAFFNKEYGLPPFDDKAVLQKLAAHVQAIANIMSINRPDTGAVAVDDMLLWFRNVAFLTQPDFIAAMGPYAEDQILRARIWRIYMLCWAAKSCLRLEGDFMDVGCYDGRTVEVMERYTGFRNQRGKTWYLYDIFDEPPTEARKSGHGPQLFDRVRATFEPFGNFRVFKGPVPDTFAQGLPEKVAFAQIDLNTAEPEIATLDAIYDRIVPGGMIVFDDYGFRRHRPSYEAELVWFEKRGDIVWESPTGQGLFIKR